MNYARLLKLLCKTRTVNKLQATFMSSSIPQGVHHLSDIRKEGVINSIAIRTMARSCETAPHGSGYMSGQRELNDDDKGVCIMKNEVKSIGMVVPRPATGTDGL